MPLFYKYMFKNVFYRDLFTIEKMFVYERKIEKVQRDVRSEKSRKKIQVREKNWSQQVENMQVPDGTGPGVRNSKRPLSACFIRRKCSMETSHKSIEGRVR